MKVKEAKKIIKEVQIAAREAEGNPAAQAAVIAYSSVGVNEKMEVYDEIAERECKKMEENLRKNAIIEEPNPAKINWYC